MNFSCAFRKQSLQCDWMDSGQCPVAQWSYYCSILYGFKRFTRLHDDHHMLNLIHHMNYVSCVAY